MFGNKGMPNLKQLEKMQKRILEAQEKVNEMTIEAAAGGGAVKVVVSGARELKSITIDPEVVDPEDVEMLQDLVLTAVNEGIKKAEQMAEAEMKKVMPAMPGLF